MKEHAIWREGPPLTQAVNDALRERRAQDDKWGEQNHSPVEWLAILTEEVGEAAAEALSLRFGGKMATPDSAACYRAEMVQVAAVALAAIESHDRQSAATPESEADR